MNRILKHNWEERKKIFFSSDWHIFHDPSWDVPIWEMRGYLNAQDASERILQKINERVPEDGILYYLGDIFLNATDEKCVNWLSRVMCKDIRFLWGNHCSNMYRIYKQDIKDEFGFVDMEVYPYRSKTIPNVTFLGNHQEIRIGKRNIVLNHFPIHSWNGMGGRKAFMVSGHQHNADKTRNPDAPINRCIDVGWDWKKDVWSFEEIEDVMSVKTFVSYDHHTTDN